MRFTGLYETRSTRLPAELVQRKSPPPNLNAYDKSVEFVVFVKSLRLLVCGDELLELPHRIALRCVTVPETLQRV